MSSDLQQDKRVATLKTPLGGDKLVLSRFEGSEGLSELFEFRVECLSKESSIDFDKVLGETCTVSMDFFKGAKRYFNGVAVEAQSLGVQHDLHVYRLVLRPSLWLLSRRTDCRIWHEKTALVIIKEVLGDNKVEIRDAISEKNFPKLEYCVQYRETDFAFVSRLMEQHGIYYYFEHSDGKHVMVLADSKSSHKPVPDHETIRYMPNLVSSQVQDQALSDWSSERRFRSGKVELRDYYFKTPNANMTGDATGREKYSTSKLEHYDYPGKYDKNSDGKTYAQIRLDAEQAVDHHRFTSGEAPNLFPGGLVTVKDHPVSAENREFLIVRCSHFFTAVQYRSGDSGSGERPYHGAFEFLPSDKVFRPPHITPKPTVHGPQTAKVVARSGKDGEEIDVDDDGFGRIKVLFHWDRKDARSCWVRVAQMWAGPNWGGQFIPRIGMEVVVEFLEGDPDRPLIVGAVYNGNNQYPYSLPANATQSGIKSDSSKGHGGYNELMFEDKKGSEKIRMHAQKDHEVVILNLETTEIGEKFSGSGESRTTTLKAGSDKLAIQTGDQTVQISQGKQSTTVFGTISIESTTDSITLSTGASSIKLTPSKIEITSMQIAVSAPKIDHN